MCVNNKMSLTFPAISENEAFARSVISCFALSLNPSVSQIADIKTAISEAVTNSIVHGYPNKSGEITINAEIKDNFLHINVIDNGVGIDDIDKALEPFFSSCENDERSGMGFTIMQSFMDEVKVESTIGKGTKIYMLKIISDELGK